MQRKKSKCEQAVGQYFEMDIYDVDTGTRVVICDYTSDLEAVEVVLSLARALGAELAINCDSPCG